MRSTDRRILRADTLTYFAVALASTRNPLPLLPLRLLERGAALGVVAVGPEGPRHRELPQLVADHRLGDEHRDVLAPVVHGDGVPHHLRHHRGAAGPPPYDPPLATAGHFPPPFLSNGGRRRAPPCLSQAGS